jgi:hypothetical protein
MMNKNQRNIADAAAKLAFQKRRPMPGGGMVNIDPEIIKKGEDMLCQNEIPDPEKPGEFFTCGGPVFVDAYRLKYVSPIMTPTGQQTVGNVMIGKICVACGKVFSPDEWLAKRQKNVDEGVQDKRDGGLLDEKGDPIK